MSAKEREKEHLALCRIIKLFEIKKRMKRENKKAKDKKALQTNRVRRENLEIRRS